MKAFIIEPNGNSRFLVKITLEAVAKINTMIQGSYAVLPARLFGLEYHSYLRMVRDIYSAELVGKNSKYVIPYFTDKKKVEDLCLELNKRWNTIIK